MANTFMTRKDLEDMAKVMRDEYARIVREGITATPMDKGEFVFRLVQKSKQQPDTTDAGD